jgi:hypothetical protein
MTTHRLIAPLLLLVAAPACGADDSAPESPPCDEACRDATAVRSLREIIKLAYNLTLQGNEVGEQDETTRCPHGGSARVAGVAVANAFQGATELELGYELRDCAYQRKDEDAEQSYDVVINGIVTEQGTLAVQPTATTALIFESEALSVSGTVYNPPFDYAETDCALRLVQDANHISGTWCERKLGFDL